VRVESYLCCQFSGQAWRCLFGGKQSSNRFGCRQRKDMRPLDTTEARLGEAVESKALLVGVDCLRALDRAWLEQISEVHIDKNLVITAYTMDKSVITLGIADNQVAAKMEALQAMLRDLYSRGERGQRINLTQLNRPVIQR